MRSLHLQKVLGAGSFGTVYLAELAGARGFSRQVAVKVLLNNHPDGALFLSRVRDEARLLGLLQDEHILKVLELTQVSGRDAVVMEYVEGVDLDQLVAAQQQPPPRALAEIGVAVAGALQKAHTATHPSTGQPLAVIHRDVKPANIMVTVRGGVKLLDFGVASARFDARESKTGQFLLGTLNYIAPEYIITAEVSPKADVYGLGLTLWEAICGTVYGQPRIKQDQHEKRLRERLAEVPASHQALVPILQKMLAWNPLERPDAATVERMLLAAADNLTGISLRSWAGASVPKVMSGRPPTQDAIGLSGKTIPIADESADSTVSLPSPPPAAPSLTPAQQTPAPVAKKKKKKAGIDWRIVVLQAVLLGAGFGMFLLLLLTALLFLRNVL